MRWRSRRPSVCRKTLRPRAFSAKATRPTSACSSGSPPPIHNTGALLLAAVRTESAPVCEPEPRSNPFSCSVGSQAAGKCRSGAPPLPSYPGRNQRSRQRSRVSLRGNFIRVSEAAAHPELFRTELDAAEFRFARVLRLPVEAREGVDRERIAIEVIFQVEDA